MLDEKSKFGGAFFMAKYSAELKFEIVQFYLAGNVSFKDTAVKYQVNKSDVQKWVAAYRQHGLEGLITQNGGYSGDFKLSVVEYMRNTGCSARQTSAYFNIPSYTTVCKWERVYLEEGVTALYIEHRGRKNYMSKASKDKKPKLEKETKEDLIAEVQRLRMENEYLKKLNALIQEKEKSAKKTKQ